MEQPQNREPIFDHQTALDVQDKFHTWMGKHTGSDKRISLLDNDPERYHFQSVNIIHIPPSPEASLDKVRQTGEIVLGPAFANLVNDFKERPKDLQFVRELLYATPNPKSISLFTDHGQLINNALVQAALFCALDDESLVDRNVTILNHMTAFMGFRVGPGDPIPAVEVLSNMGHIIKAVPRTSSARGAGLTDELADPMNSRMLSEMRPLIRSGIIQAVAPSGTTDKVVTTNGEQVVLMQRATTSAAKLTALCKFGWAVETDFNRKDPRWSIKDIRPLNGPRDVHQRMEEIANSHSESSGMKTRYETEQDAEKRIENESRVERGIARSALS